MTEPTTRITFVDEEAFDEFVSATQREAARAERERLARLTVPQLVSELHQIINPPGQMSAATSTAPMPRVGG